MSEGMFVRHLEGIAQGAALQHKGEQEYLPTSIEQAHLFQPHAWVLSAMTAAYHRGRDDQRRDTERNN